MWEMELVGVALEVLHGGEVGAPISLDAHPRVCNIQGLKARNYAPHI